MGARAPDRRRPGSGALLGYKNPQARSTHQPVIHEQFGRWIAYIGHHDGTEALPNPPNPLTGVNEGDGPRSSM